MANESVPSRPLRSELVFDPVSTERVSDVIAERLERAIRDGVLSPGDRLPTEQDLAREFRVGRTSVREGLQKLRAYGLIESRKGLGAFVASPQPQDPLADFARWTNTNPRAIEELVEARFALEALAAALAALRASEEEVLALERHHRDHAEAGERGDLATVVSTDEAFHERIMAAGRNQFLQRMYDLLITELRDFRRKTLALPWAVTRSANGHEAILEAIRRRDPTAARQAMIDHLWVLYAEVQETAAAEGNNKGEMKLLPREALTS
jgi:GntR family transcriptional regulator, transcriptional repressor for pyruvate dehydrogenase complex